MIALKRHYAAELARHPDGRYIFAVSGPSGYAHYQTYPMTRHYQRVIRRIALRFDAPLPERIKWDEIPWREFISGPELAIQPSTQEEAFMSSAQG